MKKNLHFGCKVSANRAKYQRKTSFSLYFRDEAYLRAELKDTNKRAQIKEFILFFVEREYFRHFKWQNYEKSSTKQNNF